MAQLATVAAFGFSDFNPPTLLPLYRELGCRSLQFYRNVKRPPTVADARQVAADVGLPFDSIHGVFGPEHDPSSPDEPTRQAAMQTYRQEGELARDLGGPMVVVHPAPMAADPAIITDSSRAFRIDPMRRSMDQLARIGESLGVTYLIENIPGNYHFGSDARQLAGMIRKLNTPFVRMCFDTGHAHLTTSTSVDRDLQECLDVVTYFHVNDNDGKLDSHLFPGLGACPWPGIARQVARLPPATPLMLELFYIEADLKAQLATGLGERLRGLLGVAT